ncbi:hypothetical protein [Rhodopirellula halodulae]|uniref:hypothetical protein n=1 Tax=Rhodopirellula halodulae TaxID=2894198 RepID=UPI001E37F2B6|nr:hypothetical protein [Rhodopirellula sp. JC737]MCC9656210.1 hypothetical protein [Rhodopirellula sp. JC737]
MITVDVTNRNRNVTGKSEQMKVDRCHGAITPLIIDSTEQRLQTERLGRLRGAINSLLETLSKRERCLCVSQGEASQNLGGPQFQPGSFLMRTHR